MGRNFFILIAALGLILGIVVILTYNSTNRSEIQKENELQKLKRAGFPTTIDELVSVEIPDSENGAIVYREAFKIKESLNEKYKNEWRYIENSAEFDKASAEVKNKIAKIILNDNDFAELFRLLEKASQMKCQFLKKKDYQEGLRMPFSHLTPLRSCFKILTTKIRIEADAGMADKALSTCLTALRITRFSSDEPIFISRLLSIALNIAAIDSLNEVINKGSSNSDLYVAIIKKIELERKSNKIQPALKGELVIILREFERYGERNSNKPEDIYPGEMTSAADLVEKMKPFIQANPGRFWTDQTVTYCQMMYTAIPLFEKPYTQALKELRILEEQVEKLPPKNAILVKLIMPSFSKAYIQEKKIDAYLGAAEIGLANKLYKNKYGKYVDSLSQLMPDFLQLVPMDPFTENDYIYKKKDKGFMVCSGGESKKIECDDNCDIAWIDKGN